MCPGAKALAHKYFDIWAHKYLKGAAAPPAAGPFNSTLHTGDPILGLNFVLLYFVTYALH